MRNATTAATAKLAAHNQVNRAQDGATPPHRPMCAVYFGLDPAIRREKLPCDAFALSVAAGELLSEAASSA